MNALQLMSPTAASDLVIGIGPFVAGLIVTAALITAVWLGIRVRRREPAPPRPDEHPHRPTGSGPPEVLEHREPDEMPRDGGRLTPHELHHSGNASGRAKTDSEGDPEDPEKREPWSGNSGGAFGSGGPGR
ncbi:DUF6479 family protein [Streptomyces hypolithicus]